MVWCSNGKYRHDITGQSFIFSLTNKDKFRLNQSANAIYDDFSYGPTFGNGHDLHIAHDGHIQNWSYSKINNGYNNNKYTKDDSGSLERFVGNAHHNFKVKEWEVWRVVFEE